ncbi:calcium-binding protein [Acuticoccus sediminis]|uniref:hypothetical protein n=1 Tax=Acuticoccus sediminis TaxID=2184697 RepID=UPI001CFC9A97|nr:hypothetical protein [Acuticoccus sediminis]
MLHNTRADDLVRGTGGRDLITGSNGNDLTSGLGQDTLRGRLGADMLDGSKGRDFLVGGDGYDTFVFTQRPDRDVIRDFDPGEDALDVRLPDAALDYAVERGHDTLIILPEADRPVPARRGSLHLTWS